MIKQIPHADFIPGLYRPNATIQLTPDQIERRCGIKFEQGKDDLDAYVVAYLVLDGSNFFYLWKYGGTPIGVDIYMPMDLIEGIRNMTERISEELQIDTKEISWIRDEHDTPPEYLVSRGQST